MVKSKEDESPKITEILGPHPVDVHVGKRLRMRRKSLGMSQERLGSLLGLTFQQVQKYENGSNRISASKLFDTAKALQSSIHYFFEGLANAPLEIGVFEEKSSYKISGAKADKSSENEQDADELVVLFKRISDPKLKVQLLRMARVLAGGE